jgi:uncharacterized protein DUF6916
MTRTMGLAPDLATFERLVNSRFLLRVNEDASVELELVEVRRESSAAGWEVFSLLFQAPADAPAEQRMYELEHQATGAGFELFLVPIERTEGGLRYQAVFNRRIDHTLGGD